MGIAHHQVADGVVLTGEHALHTPPGTMLAVVGAHRDALDIAVGREGYHHLGVGHQFLPGEFSGLLGQDEGLAGVAVFFLQFQGLPAHLRQHLLGVGQKGLQALYLLAQSLVFLLQFPAVQGCQTAQLHVQDGLGLRLGKAEALHQALAGGVGVGRLADDGDNLVQELEGDAQALQDVGTLSGLPQVVLGTAGNYLLAVLDVKGEEVLQAQETGLALHQGQHVEGEGGLEGGVLEEVVQDDLRLGLPLQFHHHPQALPVRLVPHLGDTLYLLVPCQEGNTFYQAGLVHLVGDLGNDNGRPALFRLLNLRFGPQEHPPLAGVVGPQETLASLPRQQDAPGGEIRPLDDGQEVLHRGIGVVNEVDDGVANLGEVVGRDGGGHAHGDTAGTVDQQVREAGGKHHRLLKGAIKVRDEIHSVPLNVGQHLFGDGGEAGLGIAHGSGGVVVNGAEVALAIHQGVAQGEILGHAHHRLVDRGIAVGMIFPQHLPHDTGRLLIGGAGAQAQLVHGVEDASLHGLEAVPHIGQGPCHDNRHGVVQVRGAQFLLNAHGGEDFGDGGTRDHSHTPFRATGTLGRRGR
ncbi:hypothetical protein HRbin23_01560 [bacterium HR23]|nr:hypothetical protein HRbin23_01560 [bacterium HR23]